MNRIRSRVGGYRLARKSWVCLDCGFEYARKVGRCGLRCLGRRIQYCASAREARRLRQLLVMQRAGAITDLRCQPRYECMINGQHICTYIADFAYVSAGPREYGPVVEDAKGTRAHQDPASALRRRLAEVLHAIVVRLV